jgi:hypothetical protein
MDVDTHREVRELLAAADEVLESCDPEMPSFHRALDRLERATDATRARLGAADGNRHTSST